MSTSTSLVVLYGWNVPWFCYKEIFLSSSLECSDQWTAKAPVELGHLTRFSLVSLRNYVDVIFTHCKATITSLSSSSSSSLCLHACLTCTDMHSHSLACLSKWQRKMLLSNSNKAYVYTIEQIKSFLESISHLVVIFSTDWNGIP